MCPRVLGNLRTHVLFTTRYFGLVFKPEITFRNLDFWAAGSEGGGVVEVYLARLPLPLSPFVALHPPPSIHVLMSLPLLSLNVL